jgi:predicted nuclease with RNAse H fold
MLIAGLDLAAEPKNTALAVIDWRADSASLLELRLDVRDSEIVDAASGFDKLGIDCALGWPKPFADFLAAQVASAGRANPNPNHDSFVGDIDFRRTLAYRETDRNLYQLTGRWPLSVSTDRLGLTAIRAAGILSQLAAAGVDADRAGRGLVVEVYPGATIRRWGFAAEGYRTSTQIRADLLAELVGRAPWLLITEEQRALAVESCDAFDAVFAALAARAAKLERFHKPNPDQFELAEIEGWLALPDVGLEDLAPNS